METREEIVSKLELIRENILGFIQARFSCQSNANCKIDSTRRISR